MISEPRRRPHKEATPHSLGLFATGAARWALLMRDVPIIAIVDDDEGIRTSLSSLVRSLGYDVCSYGSAAEFLDDTTAGDPDCMLLDIQMPAMTGDQLQTRLIASGRRFPIIVMTAFPTNSLRERVMAAGAYGFLQKPADAERIAGCLERALSRDG